MRMGSVRVEHLQRGTLPFGRLGPDRFQLRVSRPTPVNSTASDRSLWPFRRNSCWIYRALLEEIPARLPLQHDVVLDQLTPYAE
jgi:hypothetical protein